MEDRRRRDGFHPAVAWLGPRELLRPDRIFTELGAKCWKSSEYEFDRVDTFVTATPPRLHSNSRHGYSSSAAPKRGCKDHLIVAHE